MNIAGLISGNLKRHLRGVHDRVPSELVEVYGETLIAMCQKDCRMCEDHAEALQKEMEETNR